MGSIFISYRRADSEGYAGRLWDRLEAKFGGEQVFMDVDSIGPGEKFPQILSQALDSCDVLIAVIGAAWAGALPEGKRRIDDAADFVRREVADAIARDIAVIPVLVGGAKLMQEAELPDELSMLPTFNAVEIRHASFNTDIQKLLAGIERALLNAQKRREKAALKLEEKQTLTPIFGITPGESTRGDLQRLLDGDRFEAFGKLKKTKIALWEFEFARIAIQSEGEDYTANQWDLVRSIEYWGNEPLRLGFTTKMTLEEASAIAKKHYVWLGNQDFRGLVFSNRQEGPILLEISWRMDKGNPLTYKIFGSI
jgi:hypothetical protein